MGTLVKTWIIIYVNIIMIFVQHILKRYCQMVLLLIAGSTIRFILGMKIVNALLQQDVKMHRPVITGKDLMGGLEWGHIFRLLTEYSMSRIMVNMHHLLIV